MADTLTPRQREILDFIRNSLEVLGAPPTRAEIAGAFGFASHNAAEEHLKALAKKGAIVLDPRSARGIRLVEQLGLPLIGAVAAGSRAARPSKMNWAGAVDPALFRRAPITCCNVRGDSMTERRHPRSATCSPCTRPREAQQRPDRRRAPGRRGHRQATAAQGLAHRTASPKTPTTRPSPSRLARHRRAGRRFDPQRAARSRTSAFACMP